MLEIIMGIAEVINKNQSVTILPYNLILRGKVQYAILREWAALLMAVKSLLNLRDRKTVIKEKQTINIAENQILFNLNSMHRCKTQNEHIQQTIKPSQSTI